MKSAEIRQRFLDYFVRNEHTHVESSSLVPADDPTLLFTNAGMVQFKATFLGQEKRPYRRATTVQKCVRAGGKHNDLEQVGATGRHHTFFEMLGNFSFGDYFKREAIRFGWELCTEEYGLEPDRIWATVHHTDNEAFDLWQEVAGLPPERIKRFGDADNFWQMAETGPCGPSSEIHYDQRAKGATQELSTEQFAELTEDGSILEIWNLVFMQFDRDEKGNLEPLPKPSIDTGAGLERFAAVLQDVDSNFHTDLFMPLIHRAEEVMGRAYEAEDQTGVSFRVLADHARACTFLIGDGVFPTNEGRGYVLRRILRRASRHAWLLGRHEPTLYEICDEVIATMGEVYPELEGRRDHIVRTAQAEEERFMSTIDGGMARFESAADSASKSVITGADAFELYDTFGLPLDLIELMARERELKVDLDGFDKLLEEQRRRSRKAREKVEAGAAGGGLRAIALDLKWHGDTSKAEQNWIGYDELTVDTEVLAAAEKGDRVFLQLKDNPFYAEAGGQISDRGYVEGDGWRLRVDEVARQNDRVVVVGTVEGKFVPGDVRAAVDPMRSDTHRNHTATHLLHAALRTVLGEHVTQAGSLVAPDRLRFDFTHTGPLSDYEIDEVEQLVNEQIWVNIEVTREQVPYKEAIGRGAMALFGEKYGDIVRVIGVPGFSLELCGGCHVRTTGEIGLFRIVSETGSAAGVRRIEAITGPRAYDRAKSDQHLLGRVSASLKTRPEDLESRLETLVERERGLQEQMKVSVHRAAESQVKQLIEDATAVDGATVAIGTVEAADSEALRQFGDQLRNQLGSGIGVVAAAVGDKHSLLAVVTDDLIAKGVRADAVVREVAKLAGGKGGGRPHLAQGSTSGPEKAAEALKKVPDIVRPMLSEVK